jgi:hypothetical protein
VEGEFTHVVDDGVAGVVPAGEADDIVGPFCEGIDDFPFAFVAPLGADDSVSWHFVSLYRPIGGWLVRRCALGAAQTLVHV